jgi:superfamily II DNA/RNA helicase
MYDLFVKESVLYTKSGTINAVHAGARVKKLLQLVSGGVYDEDGNVQYLHQERYDIVMQLVSTRAHSLVAFNWKHERDALIQLAEKQNISYELIDGSVPAHKRSAIVDRFSSWANTSIVLSPSVSWSWAYTYKSYRCYLVFAYIQRRTLSTI